MPTALALGREKDGLQESAATVASRQWFEMSQAFREMVETGSIKESAQPSTQDTSTEVEI